MRPLILFALLCSNLAVGAIDEPVAETKKKLSTLAKEAAQSLSTKEHYLDHLYLQPMPKHKLQASEMKTFVVLGKGWSRITETDFWSVSEQSSLYVLIGEGEHPTKLQIEGSYLNNHVVTRLFVNGELLSEATLKNHTVDLPPNLEYSPYMHIELRHLKPKASTALQPKSLKTWKPNFNLKKIRVW